jgi:hypothetical protein
MDINHIELTPQLLTDLYETVLVHTNTTVMPQTAVIPFLGENQKNIIIVVNNSELVYLPDNEYDFLIRILAPCKVDITDVAIVNWQRIGSKDFNVIMEQLSPRIILLFDVPPSEFGLPIKFPEYQVQKFDKRLYLFAPALSQLEDNIPAKNQLWNSLKILFAL